MRHRNVAEILSTLALFVGVAVAVPAAASAHNRWTSCPYVGIAETGNVVSHVAVQGASCQIGIEVAYSGGVAYFNQGVDVQSFRINPHKESTLVSGAPWRSNIDLKFYPGDYYAQYAVGTFWRGRVTVVCDFTKTVAEAR
jgi:hypothetical protein